MFMPVLVQHRSREHGALAESQDECALAEAFSEGLERERRGIDMRKQYLCMDPVHGRVWECVRHAPHNIRKLAPRRVSTRLKQCTRHDVGSAECISNSG